MRPYHRFGDDLKLMAALGIRNYRFSVNWSRVLPDGTGSPTRKGCRFMTGSSTACWKTASTLADAPGTHDAARINFLHRYLRAFKRAAGEGVPVMGYFHWSFWTISSGRTATTTASAWFTWTTRPRRGCPRTPPRGIKPSWRPTGRTCKADSSTRLRQPFASSRNRRVSSTIRSESCQVDAAVSGGQFYDFTMIQILRQAQTFVKSPFAGFAWLVRRIGHAPSKRAGLSGTPRRDTLPILPSMALNTFSSDRLA